MQSRIKNMTDRYRCMSASNAYQHSCNAIKGLGVGSFSDFNCASCSFRKNNEDLNICTPEDLCTETKNMAIPDHLWKGIGLIEKGIEAAAVLTGQNIVQ